MDYAVSSCFREIFNVKSNANVRLCMDMFNCDDVDNAFSKAKTEVLKWLCSFGQHIVPSSSDVI